MQKGMFRHFLLDDSWFRPEDIKDKLVGLLPLPTVKTNRKLEYINVPAAFDIETTSFYDKDGEKSATMYCWTFGIFGIVFFGRTWEQFKKLIGDVIEILEITINRRLCVFVHNLAFDFQFFRKHFSFDKVFAVNRRKPVYAVTESGVEFRCSYILTGYSLAKLGEQLVKYPVRKLVGDLDYSLIRHCRTFMTEKEIGYCVGDVKVVMAYIMEKIETMGGIHKLPLTKTGFVRDYCRTACFGDKKQRRVYQNFISNLTLDVPLYRATKRAFMGGFTHANALYVGRTLEGVASQDFTSSYPAVMVAEQFPMSPPESVDTVTMTKEEFYENMKYYCCKFDIHFVNIKMKEDVWENYISESRCFELKDKVVNNGRVVSASSLWTTITEVDFSVIKKVYDWEKMQISNFTRWKKDFLPRDFVYAVLELYQKKTQLKNVEDKKVEYMRAKEDINSCFGMTCTDIIQEENVYEDLEWLEPSLPDIEATIEKYNNSRNRFLYYPWGVWITAYARRNLFSGILECGIDYVYSDTDSVKYLHPENHVDYFERYNKIITAQLEDACRYHGIDVEMLRPKTIKGVEKPLGVWDFEGVYSRFKTLGAKRYMTEENGDISITISGVNKKIAVPYLLQKYGAESVFDEFKDGLFFPAGYTGKQTHTYIDEERTGVLTDYRGVEYNYHELSCIHLEDSEYKLSLSDTFINYVVSVIGGLNNGTKIL